MTARGTVAIVTIAGLGALLVGMVLVYQFVYRSARESNKPAPSTIASSSATPKQSCPASFYSKIGRLCPDDKTGMVPTDDCRWVCPTPSASPIKGTTRYESKKLGIRFSYHAFPYPEGGETRIKEVGNKVYVYLDYVERDDEKPEEGQYIEVFQKKPTETMEAAITGQLLKEYNAKDCSVQMTPMAKYPSSYQVAAVVYPVVQNGDNPFAGREKCHPVYSMTNGIQYFLMDTNVPNKFAFLSIGQYGISAGIEDKMWQDTIEFY